MSEMAYEEQESRFVVDNDRKAEWCVDKIRQARQDKAEWKKYYAEQLAKIEAECDETINKMEMMLEEYFYSENCKHKKTATQESYSLKGGKLVLKQQKPEYDHDDEKLVPWLEKNRPEFVKVRKEADWAGLKKEVTYFDGQVVDENGEVVPGVTATPRPNIFKVEVD